MTNKEKLIKFVKAQDKIIKEKTGIHHINKLDIQEICEWDEESCQKIYLSFTKSINVYFIHDLPIGTCPWCLKSTVNYVHDCKLCGYGKRHGICDEEDSLFKKYILKWEVGFITNDMYMKILQDIEQSEISSLKYKKYKNIDNNIKDKFIKLKSIIKRIIQCI